MNKKDIRFLYFCVIASLILMGVTITMSIEVKKKRDAEKQKSEQLDAKIANTFNAIDSLRTTRTRRINDSLAQHSEYVYTAENRHKIDSLTNKNIELLNNAYNAARNYSMTRVAYNNESVFSDFSDIPLVRNSGIHYNKNKRIIQDFNQKKSVADYLENNIRRYIDSVTVAEIFNLQLKLNNMLQQKYNRTKNR